MAHVEIFILNYNGSRFLPECLESLRKVTRGEHSIDISVVDNNSSDDSQAVVARFEEIHFIPLSENFGFSKGNNLGVWERLKTLRSSGRDADYLCFLNNDTRVSESWLIEAVRRFELSPKAGIVGSKALFYDSFVEVELELLHDAEDASGRVPVEVVLRDWDRCGNLQEDLRRTKWLGWQSSDRGTERIVYDSARTLLAVRDVSQEFVLDCVIENRSLEPISVKLTVQGEYQILSLQAKTAYLIRQAILPATFRNYVQNAGSFVTPTWEAGDLGMYTQDQAECDDSRQVAAVCGVSMFVRASLFEKLGGFDETFFAYFEDTDLSLRARIEGAECWYAAPSRLYHIHCGSGGEWSPYFNFNVTFSHLVFGSRWMGFRQFLSKSVHVCRFAWRELRVFAEDQDLETKPNLRTLVRILKNLPAVVGNRWFYLLNRGGIQGLVNGVDNSGSCRQREVAEEQATGN